MKRAYADVTEGQIHYRTEGSGEPIVLIHATSSSSEEYSRMIPLLSQNHRVIAMDTLGYGKSDKPTEGFKVGDYAQAAVNFIKALGISRTSIFGHLTGSAIAMEVAVANPDLVDKLVLCDCPFYLPEVLQSRLSDPRFLHKTWEVKADGSHLIKRWEMQRSYSPNADPEETHESMVAVLQSGLRNYDGYQAVFRYDMEKRLPLIKCPTLLISGTEAIGHERVEAVKALIPRCRVVIIEGASHTTRQNAKECTEAILGFLKAPGV